MINIGVSDVANVEQVLRNLLQDETVEVSERAISQQLLQDQEVLGCHGARARDSSDCLPQTNRQTDRLVGSGTDSSFTRGQPLLPRKSDAKSDSNW